MGHTGKEARRRHLHRPIDGNSVFGEMGGQTDKELCFSKENALSIKDRAARNMQSFHLHRVDIRALFDRSEHKNIDAQIQREFFQGL